MSNIENKKNSIQSAILQFLVGDWEWFNTLCLDDFDGVEEKQKLSLMIAIASLQLGDRIKAKEVILLSKTLGASKSDQAKHILSSLYNTLGRARAINGEHEKADEYFRKSIKTGDIDTDQNIALKARILKQYTQLNISNKNYKITKNSISLLPTTEILSKIDLGDAWAGNTINTVIFRHHGILTWREYQYTAFYVDEMTLRVVQRNLNDHSFVEIDIIGRYNLKDAHNSISLGIDRKDHVHISYDHHGTSLRYRRTQNPADITKWTDELSMTGVNEEKVTYPTFILPNNDRPLLILYRDGNWKKGSGYIKEYNEETASWYDYESTILSGTDQKPWTSNAYWNHPVQGNDGTLHLSYVWRTDYFSDEQLVNNINIGYAKSYDNGHSWFTSQGHPYMLPITQVNSEIVWPVPPGSNLINQTSMALDSKNQPHIVFYANDENQVPQYQHVWFDGKKWQQTYASSREQGFVLSGGGTLKIPISRPDIVIDEDDNVYMIHRGKETKERMVATFLPAPNYEYNSENTLVLFKGFLGCSEPVIDRVRWKNDKVLSMLLQYNEQPNGDISHQNRLSNVTIVDIVFNTQERSQL